MITESISDDIPPQMKILIMVIPRILQFCLKLEHSKPHNGACHPTKCDVINEVKLFPAVYRSISQDILLQIFDVIQSDVALQKKVHLNLFLLANKILISRAGIHKMLNRTANWEDPDQTASSEAV